MPAREPRTRLCLVTPPVVDPATFPAVLQAALAAGDVATLFVTGDGSAASTQRIAEVLIPVAQSAGTAGIVLNDTRLLGRAGADGVHIDTGMADLASTMERFRGKKIVGAGGLRSRHDAMQAGEREPDYLFFGKLDGDTADTIFPKALDLAQWWSGLFEIPAVVMGGHSTASALEAAEAGIEFIALRTAIWEHPEGPAAAVAEANRILAGEIPAW